MSVAPTRIALTPSYRSREKQVFSEPGATNEFGEYKWWLHVWDDDTLNGVISNVYPWPFAIPKGVHEPAIDGELLAAFMNTTKMRNWPGGWPVFGLGAHRSRKYFWKLAPGAGKHWLQHTAYLAQIIPEVFLNALT